MYTYAVYARFTFYGFTKQFGSCCGDYFTLGGKVIESVGVVLSSKGTVNLPIGLLLVDAALPVPWVTIRRIW